MSGTAAWFSSFSAFRPFPPGSSAPLRSVPVMEQPPAMSFRSLQRSRGRLSGCIHLKIVDTRSFPHYIDVVEALKYFYLTIEHKKKFPYKCSCQRSPFPIRRLYYASSRTKTINLHPIWRLRCYLTCDLHIRLNYFARRHGRFQPSAISLCFLNTAQSCLRFPDLLPTCLPQPSSRHPSGSFSLRLLSADRGCCASRLLFFLAFEFLPPEPRLQNFGTCLRTSNTPRLAETAPIWLLFL